MEDLDNPLLEKKIEEIRKTLQMLGTSFTEDDTSEFGKSAFSSEESFYKKIKFNSPQMIRNLDIEKYSKLDLICNQKKNTEENEDPSLSKNNYKTNEEHPKEKLLEKEVKTLKDLNEDLRIQVNDLAEQLEKKEKELAKILVEKEVHLKAEEDLKKTLNESRKTESELKKEIKSLRFSQEKLEIEKKDLSNLLSEQCLCNENLQQELKLKIEEIQFIRNSKDPDIDSPRSPVVSFDPKKFNFQRLRIPEKLSPTSPERTEYLTDRQDPCKSAFKEAMKIVGVHDFKDFYPKLIHLRQYHSKYKKAKQIVERISDMMTQCSPEGTFKRQPSVRQIWRWVTRLLEEYMKLKQSIAGDLIYKLSDVLEVQHLEDIYERVVELVNGKFS